MPESRNRDLATSLGQAVKNDTITSTGSLAVVGLTAYDSAGLLPSSYDSNNAGTLGFAEDSDKLYIHTGQGWFNIAIINTTPIFTTSPSASYTLATDATAYKNGTATVITLAARDSEGFPVTFSATGNSAFNNIAYVDKDSAAGFIFTVEPKSLDSVGEAAPAAGTLTFSVTDGINTASATSTFSLTFDTTVANSEDTSLFLTAQGNNQDNYSFVDESDSPHTISNVSSASNSYTIGVSPYAAPGYSWQFGEGHLNYPENTSGFFMPNNSRFAFGTGDFTIEYWCWNDESAGGSMMPFDFRGAGGLECHNLCADMFSAGTWYIRLGTGNLFNTSSTWRHPRYEWVHYAFVRASGTTKMYANGTEVASASDTSTYTSTGSGTDSFAVIGRGYKGFSGSNEGRWKGYISDFRVVKGTAVYTANFTPPTEPLTAISGTTVLTCNTPYVPGYVRGAAGNGFLIDNDEVTKITAWAFSPYKVQEKYDTSKHGGALSPQTEVQVGGHTDFAFGTGDFTVECWYFRKSFTGGTRRNIYDSRHSSNVGICIYEDTDYKIKVSYGTTSSETVILQETRARANPSGLYWTHIALARASGTGRLYVNGDNVQSQSFTTDINNDGGNVIFSGDDGVNILGPIRVIKGTAAYTGGAFYPPTSNFTKTGSTYHSLKEPYNDSVTSVNNSITESHTVFLANWTNGGILVHTGNLQLKPLSTASASGPKSSTGSQKYSIPSILFDKTDFERFEIHNSFDDMLVHPDANESVTWECWVQWSGTAETQDGVDPRIYVFRQSSPGSATESSVYADISNSNRLTFYMGSTVTGSSALTMVGPNTNILDGNWHHVAISREKDNGKIFLFVDGVSNDGTSYTGRWNSGGYGGVGGNIYITSPSFKYTGGWNGYISQLRLKKESIYPFFPKKETLTTSTSFQNGITIGNSGANTKLLTAHAASITDGSDSGHTVTTNNGATVSNFAPMGGMKSVSFDGSNDYLSVPDHADFDVGSGAFTIECWVYAKSLGSYNAIVGQWENSGGHVNNSFVFESVSNSGIYYPTFYYSYGGANYSFFAHPTAIVAHKWYHLAIVRSGNDFTIFVNGTAGTTVTGAHTINNSSSVLSIGGNVAGAGWWNGYISNLRIVKGQALYTRDFTPPSEAIYG